MISVSFFGKITSITKKDIRNDLSVYIGYLKTGSEDSIRVESFKPLPEEGSLVFGTGLLKIKPVLHVRITSIEVLEEAKPAATKNSGNQQLEFDLDCPF